MQLRILLSLTLVFSFFSLSAQDMTSPLLDGSWQSTFSNPALMHRLPARLTIGLPGVYNDFSVDNFTYNDLISEENGRTFFDADRAIPLLGDRNQLRNELDVGTIGIAWRNDRLALGFNHRMRYVGALEFSRELAQLIWQGNAQFIGQTVEIAPYFQLTKYHELNFSVAYKVTEQLSLGGRVKYLSGAGDISATAGSLQLTTSDDIYQLSLDQNYVVNASGALEYNGLDELNTNLDFTAFDLKNLLDKNTGIGFDVGAQLDLGALRLQASALDLGSSIDWKEDVTNVNFSGVGEFTGLDVLQSLLDDTTSFDGIIDTIERQFDPTETSNEYTSNIGARYLAGIEYDLTEKLTLGALVNFQDFDVFTETSFALSARYQLADLLHVGAVYSYRPNSAANLGLNAIAMLGPVNLLLATDNIITVFNPKDSKQANVRIGLSISLLRDEVE